MSRTPHCPFCGTPEVELVSQFGSHILTSQWVCPSCHSYFEAIREDFDDDRLSTGSAPVSEAPALGTEERPDTRVRALTVRSGEGWVRVPTGLGGCNTWSA